MSDSLASDPGRAFRRVIYDLPPICEEGAEGTSTMPGQPVDLTRPPIDRFRSDEDDDWTVRNHTSLAHEILQDLKVKTLEDGDETTMVWKDTTGIWKEGENWLKSELGKRLGSANNTSRVRETARIIERQTFTPNRTLEGATLKIPVENGVLDLRDWRLEKASAEDHFTWQLPVTYDPDAECPLWQSFLDDVVPPEHQLRLEEWMGYSLLHWDMRHQKALLLVGDGNNGKSTYLETLRNLLGPENTSSESLKRIADPNNRFATSSLDGSLANISADLEESGIQATGTFKKLATGEPLRAEEKNKDSFDLHNRAKLFFSANQTPTAPTDDDGFFRRWDIIPFHRTIPEEKKDKKLVSKLSAPEELSGILNRALRGLRRLLWQDGFTDSPDEGEARLRWKRWQSDADSVTAFYCDKVEHKPGNRVPLDDAHTLYEKYCEENGDAIKKVGQFSKKLQSLAGIETAKVRTASGRERVFKGIEIEGVYDPYAKAAEEMETLTLET